MNLEDLTLSVEQEIGVKGQIENVFKSVLRQLSDGFTRPTGESMDMKLEEWAGGRWYRDVGDGVQYLWGHVQVIKAPALLELSGPMFMSYPALNHLEIKLSEADGETTVTLRHRAVGMIDPQHRDGVATGWNGFLAAVKGDFANTSESAA
ncbi:MAG: SRPBCC domain-containing protein [Acidobacteriota bacterium]